MIFRLLEITFNIQINSRNNCNFKANLLLIDFERVHTDNGALQPGMVIN